MESKLAVLKQFTDCAHLDVADARFTLHASWAEPETWKQIGQGVRLEAHLMVEDPELVLAGWLDAGATRVIVHLEALQQPPYHVANPKTGDMLQRMKDLCAARGATLVLGLNPETPVEALLPYAPLVTDFCLLAVHAGPAGQPFLSPVLSKVRFLHGAIPQAHIEVDGGIDPETARRAREAGATSVCAGTYIFSHEHPQAAFKALLDAVQ